MNRMFAFAAAVLVTAVTVSSACVAKDPSGLAFNMQPTGQADRVQVTFTRNDRPESHTWSSSFRHADLAGFNVAAFRGAALQPISFAVSRDAGRMDCSGQGAGSMARGACSVTANAEFNAFLQSNGIARPTAHETFGLISLDVKRELVTALTQARYAAPSLEDLMGLTAVGVSPGYIRALAAQGYRPERIEDLVQFGALDISPEYIGSFRRAGYADLSAEDLVQMKALNITPEFVAGFDRIGYGRLPVGDLVQLKALGVTPEFVRQVHQGGPLPSPERLVMLRAVGAEHRTR